MKNIFKLLIGVVVIIVIVAILKPKKESKFIVENNKEIDQIDSTQNDLFDAADNIINNMYQKKHENNKMLEDLNGKLNHKSHKLKHAQSTLDSSLLKMKAMHNICMGHKVIIDSLNKSLNFLNNDLLKKHLQIQILIDSLNNQNKIINKLTHPQYVSHIITDTVYQIDTLFYPKDKIRVLKLRK